jgi:hypothetical protein
MLAQGSFALCGRGLMNMRLANGENNVENRIANNLVDLSSFRSDRKLHPKFPARVAAVYPSPPLPSAFAERSRPRGKDHTGIFFLKAAA